MLLDSQLTHFQPALLLLSCVFFGLRAYVLPFVPYGQENLVQSGLGLGYQSSFLLSRIIHGCAKYLFSRALTLEHMTTF